MSNNFGYPDQEVLIRALATYTSTKVSKSISIIRGMIRMSIEAICEKNKTTLKEVKLLEEQERDSFYMDTMVYFFEKMNLDNITRKKMKYDFLQIYERWKESKREEIDIVDPDKALSLKSTDVPADTINDSVLDTTESIDFIDNLDSLDDFDIFSN
ncbi:MAG: hypothetical protein JXK07_10650 [Spirochaetes bacterium]|nr:hypothetical protein [Spirochaetota bacterium]MBN2769275.1 hypothetical protein [Spirochaetota bacterium]HRX14886.1 hypothetical protein [Spirochaetota bacterium]